jgi:hypothetical protein
LATGRDIQRYGAKETQFIQIKRRNGSGLELAERRRLAICEKLSRFRDDDYFMPRQLANRDANRPREIAVLVIVPLRGCDGRDWERCEKAWPNDGKAFKLGSSGTI